MEVRECVNPDELTKKNGLAGWSKVVFLPISTGQRLGELLGELRE
jgi:hypothetical protein